MSDLKAGPAKGIFSAEEVKAMTSHHNPSPDIFLTLLSLGEEAHLSSLSMQRFGIIIRQAAPEKRDRVPASNDSLNELILSNA